MKFILAISFLCLVLASVITYNLAPESQNKLPILYWATDPNPARQLQVDVFHKWLKKNGYPAFELKIDTVNNAATKVVIQSISGVAADLFDVYYDNLDYFTSIGLLKDITADAHELGFGPDKTYPAIRNEITLNGRQWTFPCGVGTLLLWINKATFEKYGQPLPPPRWTAEEFEKAGKAFVEKANAGKKRREVFFVDLFRYEDVIRSAGLDIFNETQSACALDDPRYAQALKLIYKWTFEDHLLPSDSEKSAFNAAAGYGGSNLQLFYGGNYAMLNSGIHALIQLRKFGSMRLAVTEPPHLGYPVTVISSRNCGVYTAGKRQDLARYFLAYLASEDYCQTIIADADGLPPNPEFTTSEQFLRPREYPNEWGCHEAFARAAFEIGVIRSRSPFVLAATLSRHLKFYQEQFMNDRLTAEETARQTCVRINEEIQRSLQENPGLQSLYDQRVEIQKKIEKFRREGKKAPAAWLFNPFHQKYYRDMGWVEE